MDEVSKHKQAASSDYRNDTRAVNTIPHFLTCSKMTVKSSRKTLIITSAISLSKMSTAKCRLLKNSQCKIARRKPCLLERKQKCKKVSPS